MKRFRVIEDFKDEDTEYHQGTVYDVDENTEAKIEQWIHDGKVEDVDEEDDEGGSGDNPQSA